MIEIIFQNKEDAQKLFDYYKSKTEVADILLVEDKNKGIVRFDSISDQNHTILSETLYRFILNIKQIDWFRRILREQYYYEDEDEQQQILEIIQSIVEGKREDLTSFIKESENKESLKEAIYGMFQNQISFSFDSFVRFRLRTFMNQLARYVEISIDEYKMEQEYQMFIQTLREFIATRAPKLNHLHLLFEEEISFYDDQYVEMKRAELVRMIDRRLLSNHPVYIDSVTIAPLLSIAPKEINIYTNEPEQPLVRTIQNIFEERVFIQPISCFYHKKKPVEEKM
ncbi:putative sporulation protein YtxC [Bacillus massilinigeriensis]|uniref:putative sporulation protein YtxC n=1 Tax=Bacillus massilionigeriensis TaxID=1805475 RepID=UPI00096AE067|nr:putative sporulation protein YtxC [Bacillus massilionigeriensis]